MLLILALLSLGGAIYLVGEVATYPARLQRLSVRRAAQYGHSRLRRPGQEKLRFKDRVVAPAVTRLASVALRLNPKATAEAISSKLLAAGLSTKVTPPQFLAAKAALAIAGVVCALFVGATGAAAMGVLFTPLLAACGFFVPDVFLTFRTRSRRELHTGSGGAPPRLLRRCAAGGSRAAAVRPPVRVHPAARRSAQWKSRTEAAW